MRDDQRPRRDADESAFEKALDELFGAPDEAEATTPQAAPEPTQPPQPPRLEVPSPTPSVMPAEPTIKRIPTTFRGADRTGSRSYTRIACIGCALIAGVPIICFIILLIIGIAFGGSDETTGGAYFEHAWWSAHPIALSVHLRV